VIVIISNSDIHNRLSAAKIRAGYDPPSPPCPGFSTAGASGVETHQARPMNGLQSVQPWEHFKEDFLYLFILPNVSNTGLLITIFT